MAFDFQREETNTLMLTVLRNSGAVPSFPADYTTPTIRIVHVNGDGEVEDLAITNMTQVDGSNHWFHKYTIPEDAPFKKYLAIFESTIEGVPIQTVEEFRVTQPAALGLPGSGEFAVEVTVKQAITLQPIGNAIVRVFDKSNPSIAIAQTETDANGNATVFLDTGNYLIEFSKSGVISEIHDLTVNANGTFNIAGD